MNRYDKYKDSGIEWIGDVPEHWEIKRLKRFAKICNGQDHKAVYDVTGDYPILGSGGEFGKANQYIHIGPSVLLGRKGTIDKPQYVDFPFWSVDTAYYTQISPDTDPRFFYYLCINIQFDLYKYGSAVPSMNQETLSQIQFPSPSFEEQKNISCYLDRKTTEIDRIIANKQKLIALYEEEKQAIINQAVTKGLWALSGVETPTVQLKDSGVEWLGEIPEHWEVKRLKHLTSNISKGTTPSTIGREILLSGNVRFIKAENIVNNCVVEYPENFIDDDTNEILNRSQLGKDDILFVIAGATIGKVAILDECLLPANTNQAISFIRLKDSRNVRFIWYWLQSSKIQKFLWLQAVQSAQPNLSMENLGNFTIPYPDLNEQQSIVTHIEKECTRLDTIIEKFKKQIVLLQEYRTTLISEVVTGKVKVATES